MNLIIISGFLGSGKTSLLLKVAKNLVEISKQKVAIIENEVGQVGVDDVLVKEEGLPVREIYSGCVCCTLRIDLISTLLELERKINPDVVILEPSGVAGPNQILNAFDGYGGEIDRKIFISIVDTVRFQKVQDFGIPLIKDGIQIADYILLNKIDLVSQEEIDSLTQRISKLREDADIIPISIQENKNLDLFMDGFLKDLRENAPVAEQKTEKQDLHHHPEKKIEPVVFAHQWEKSYEPSVSRDEVQDYLKKFLSDLIKELKKNGCELIGHVKIVAQTKNGGYLLLTTTSFTEAPNLKGQLPKEINSIQLTLNVIVYGIDETNLHNISKSVLQKFVFLCNI